MSNGAGRGAAGGEAGANSNVAFGDAAGGNGGGALGAGSLGARGPLSSSSSKEGTALAPGISKTSGRTLPPGRNSPDRLLASGGGVSGAVPTLTTGNPTISADSALSVGTGCTTDSVAMRGCSIGPAPRDCGPSR